MLIALALGAYGFGLAQKIRGYASGSDSSGYLNEARLLASGAVTAPPRTVPDAAPDRVGIDLYAPLGFMRQASGEALVPTYPPGLPLLIMASAKVVGWSRAPEVTLWLHAMAGVLLMYATARTFGAARRTSLIAAALLAGGPVYFMYSVHVMSDVPALVWTTAAVLGAWRSRDSSRPAVIAALSGLAFAMAVLVRPTNLLAIVPVAVALGASWRLWTWFILGGLPGAVFQMLHASAAYGDPFSTGYTDRSLFSREWIGPTLANYARSAPIAFTPFVVLFLALPFLRREHRRASLVLASWVAVFAGFYAIYRCTHETWWYLRFLLPAAPALLAGSLLVLQTAVRSRCGHVATTVAACVALIAGAGWNHRWGHKLGAYEFGIGEGIYLEAAQWIDQNAPSNAVVLAMQGSGAFYYYGDRVVARWDRLEGANEFVPFTQALQKAGRPLYAALWEFEINDQKAFERYITGAGEWKKVGQVRQVSFWQWVPPAGT